MNAPDSPFPDDAGASDPRGSSKLTECALCGARKEADEVIRIQGILVCPACKPVALQQLRESGMISHGMVWRQGSTIVMQQPGILLRRCIRCNESVTELDYSEFRLPFLLGGARSQAFIPKVLVKIPLCGRDRQRRQQTRRLVWLLVIWIILAVIWRIMELTSGHTGRSLADLTASVGVPALPYLIFVLCKGPLYPVKDDGTCLHLKGAGRPFLDSLPEQGRL